MVHAAEKLMICESLWMFYSQFVHLPCVYSVNGQVFCTCKDAWIENQYDREVLLLGSVLNSNII